MIRIPYEFIQIEWQRYHDDRILERRPPLDGYWFGRTYRDYVLAIEDRMEYSGCILNKRRKFKESTLKHSD